MTAIFLDTSAVVKRYLPETGTTWVRGLSDPASGNIITLSEITLVEVAAALAARHRASGGISQQARDAGLTLFKRHFSTEYAVVPIGRAILDRAVDLTQRHRLRGYDAVQLASALEGHAALVASGQPGLTFVAADADLVAAARAEGLLADDPNFHP
jgi:predicted nucleic acid-binding protein